MVTTKWNWRKKLFAERQGWGQYYDLENSFTQSLAKIIILGK
jgi:hypothetical protein